MYPTLLIEQLQQQLSASQADCQYQRSLKDQAHMAANDLMTENANLQAKLQEKTEQLASSHQVNYNLFEANKHDHDSLTKEKEDALAESKQLREDEQYLTTIMCDNIAKSNRLEENFADEKQNHLAYIDHLEKEIVNEKQLRQQVESRAKRNFDSWRLDVVDFHKRLFIAQHNETTMNSQLKSLEAGKVDLKAALSAKNASHEELQSEVSDLKDSQLDLENKLKEHGKKIARLEKAIDPIIKACKELLSQVTDAVTTNTLLESQRDTLEFEKKRLEEALTGHENCQRTFGEKFSKLGSLGAAWMFHNKFINLQGEHNDLQEILDSERGRRYDLQHSFRLLQSEKARLEKANTALKNEAKKRKVRDDHLKSVQEEMCLEELFEQILKEDPEAKQQKSVPWSYFMHP